jgi:ribosome-associated protein YbcJ (S4-like RNA binding protein)
MQTEKVRKEPMVLMVNPIKAVGIIEIGGDGKSCIAESQALKYFRGRSTASV